MQGDIVLAPSGFFLLSSGTDPPLGPPPAPGQRVQRSAWQADEAQEIPATSIDVQLAPAMVTSHDCTLHKDFTRRYEQLRREQVPQDEAIATAAEDPALDPLLTLAPIVPYSEAAPSGERELAQNLVVGFFPVCARDEKGIDGGVVNLLNETTVHRDAVVARLGVLSPSAVGALRYALARFWVYRAPKIAFDIEQSVGKRIVDYEVSPREPLKLTLKLEGEEELELLQAPSEEVRGPERPRQPN